MQTNIHILIIVLIFVLALFILIFIASGIKILKEWERAAVLRLGKFLGIRGPGIIWITPILDKIALKISIREQQTLVDTGKYVSEDGSASRLTGFVNWRIVDVERAVLAIENFRDSVETTINHHVRKIGESLPSDAVLSDQEQLYSQILHVLDPLFINWGIKITKIDLKAAPHWE